MKGIGIDAVDVARFRAVVARTPGVVDRMFTVAERDSVAGSVDPVPRLAARFAAKEAVMKALGVGLGAFALRDVEVVTNAAGAPSIRLAGGAERAADAAGVAEWKVSLTHTASIAQAVVAAL